MSTSLMVGVSIDVDSLLAGGMTRRDFIEFIKELDEAMCDWDFTLALADHFDKLRAEHAAEQAEDAKKERGE